MLTVLGCLKAQEEVLEIVKKKMEEVNSTNAPVPKVRKNEAIWNLIKSSLFSMANDTWRVTLWTNMLEVGPSNKLTTRSLATVLVWLLEKEASFTQP